MNETHSQQVISARRKEGDDLYNIHSKKFYLKLSFCARLQREPLKLVYHSTCASIFELENHIVRRIIDVRMSHESVACEYTFGKRFVVSSVVYVDGKMF